METDFYVDLVDGKFKETTPAHMDAMFAALAGSRFKRLVVNFHGGLVPRKSAHESMNNVLLKHYQSADAWPYFFVWNTDLVKTVTANLDEIGREKAFQRLLAKLIEFVSGKLLQSPEDKGALSSDPIPQMPLEDLAAEAAAREALWRQAAIPAQDFSPFEQKYIKDKLEKDPVLQREAQGIVAATFTPDEIESLRLTRGAAAVAEPRSSLISPALLKEELIDPHDPETRSVEAIVFFAKHGLSIAMRVIKRFIWKRDHGLYNTVVEEILRELYLDNLGIAAWNMMKKDAADAFEDEPQVCGGTRFAISLAKAMRESPGLRVTLVGHSTGAIYIANLLKALDPQLEPGRQLDVLFLAPAISLATMSAHLEYFKRRVRGFRLFGLNDARETGYWEVPGVYCGSLLYMVSGIFEDTDDDKERGDVPLLGMQRHATSLPGGPYDLPAWNEMRAWLALDKRGVWAGDPPSAAQGYLSDAFKHGGINDGDQKTLASIKYILENDF